VQLRTAGSAQASAGSRAPADAGDEAGPSGCGESARHDPCAVAALDHGFSRFDLGAGPEGGNHDGGMAEVARPGQSIVAREVLVAEIHACLGHRCFRGGGRLGHVDRETGYPASDTGCLGGSDPDRDELLPREQSGDFVDALRSDRDVPPSTEGRRGRIGRPERRGDLHASLDEEDGLLAGPIDELNARRRQVRGEQSSAPASGRGLGAAGEPHPCGALGGPLGRGPTGPGRATASRDPARAWLSERSVGHPTTGRRRSRTPRRGGSERGRRRPVRSQGP